jgi:hypothetical protein
MRFVTIMNFSSQTANDWISEVKLLRLVLPPLRWLFVLFGRRPKMAHHGKGKTRVRIEAAPQTAPLTLILTTRRSKTSVIYVDGATVAILKRWIARHSPSLPRLP